jgi:hypothetical protein
MVGVSFVTVHLQHSTRSSVDALSVRVCPWFRFRCSRTADSELLQYVVGGLTLGSLTKPAMHTLQRTPIVLAAATFLVVVAVGTALARQSEPATPATTTATDPDSGSIALVDASAATSIGAAPTATAATTVPPAATSNLVPLDRTLSEGMSGQDVKMVQQRLMDLAFNPGPIDGVYGALTVQAVWAFEKLILGTPRSKATGRVTPEMWTRLQEDVTVAPRRTGLSETHVEIYLPEQVLVVFTADRPVLIAHVSSGQLAEPGNDFTKGATWCDEVTISPGERGNEDGTEPLKDGRCGNAETPGGTYRFYRKVEGIRDSALGSLYDPVYFNYGIAVHGAQNVPLEPASHGCVRLNRYLGKIFFALITHASGTAANPHGDDVYVWNGVKEPEAYGARPGWFDTPWEEWHEENSTTSSSSSSSTSTSTSATEPPATSAPTTTMTASPVPTTTSPPTATSTQPNPTEASPIDLGQPGP